MTVKIYLTAGGHITAAANRLLSRIQEIGYGDAEAVTKSELHMKLKSNGHRTAIVWMVNDGMDNSILAYLFGHDIPFRIIETTDCPKELSMVGRRDQITKPAIQAILTNSLLETCTDEELKKTIEGFRVEVESITAMFD
jgi:hypothetical protein